MPYAGELSALVTAVMWTGSALAFAAATTRVGSVYVNVVRLVAAVVFLFVTIVVFGIQTNVSTAQVIFLSMSGFAGFVFGDTFYFKSFEYNSARISTLIMSAAPAMAALMAFLFLNETLSFTGILGMTITLAGIALVVLERKELSTHNIPISMVGVFYALLGALGQAGGMILAKGAFAYGPVNGFVATFIRAFAATLVLAPMNYFTGRFIKPREIFSNDREAFHFTILGSFLGPYLGVTFSLIAISLTDVAIAATIIALVPIIMLPMVWILFREKLSWRAIVGACVAVFGVGILFLR
ncbi:MAG: DMT family transporter [Bacteroidota bacterium]|jgi:drug/metabolite transporter (DMT)-like permease